MTITTPCPKCGDGMYLDIADHDDQETVQRLLRITRCNKCRTPPKAQRQFYFDSAGREHRLPHND